MAQSIVGKKAIITGASRGIGRAVALAWAKEGLHLGLITRTEVKDDNVEVAIVAANGLFSILQALANEKNLSKGKNKKDRTKPHRRKGTDGREL